MLYSVTISYDGPGEKQLHVEGLGPEGARGMAFDAIEGTMAKMGERSVTGVEIKPWSPEHPGLTSTRSGAED